MTEQELKEAFEDLSRMIDSLPPAKKERKNMLQIAGYPHWENVISNILAFYFDEHEEHHFGRLFLMRCSRYCGVKMLLFPTIMEKVRSSYQGRRPI